MASSSTSSIRENFKYHVFLSFRGEDTRTTFVDHLYASMKRLGIHAFRDNEELQKGKRINELFQAIEESKFFIIVFSQNYASSSWCLKELAKIMDCQDMTGRIAYPLFYDVDPTDIRKQSGPVGRAIAKYKSDKEIKTWKKALEEASNLVGWDLKKIANGHEAEAIDQIVKEISIKLRSINLSKNENLVGMKSRMQDLELSLGKGFDDEVRMIGIKGMGGIGKTTLATTIFHEMSAQFEGKSFVDNVREASKVRGLLSLQQQVLRDVFSIDNVTSVPDAISTMKMKMPLKKVLIVLDDVNHKDQLEALAGDWFKDGSRIIITTRDEQVLRAHRVKLIHNINLLSEEEAISLFSRYAFERYIPTQGYADLSIKVVKYADGLPLTLKVLGSFLLGKGENAWRNTLKRLEKIPEKETLDKLEISYNGLEDDYKEIFLDVACFMKGMWKEDAIRILESRGFDAIIGLEVLEERSLINILNERLGMHDSIEELGRNIVRRVDPREPEKHSRLWVRKEIEALLSHAEVSEATATCIRLLWGDLSPEVIIKGLGKLKKLRVLHISGRYGGWLRNNQSFDQYSFERSWRDHNFLNSLQFLKWERYPGRSLPQTFQANNLVGLELSGSKITLLWESEEQKVLSNLRFLNLSESKLTVLDLGMTPNLEWLDLQGCCDLTRLDVRAECLKRLVYLNLIDCSSFKPFLFIQQLESLELLSLSKLEVIVESFRRNTYDNLPELSFTCLYVEEQTSSLENSQKSISLNLEPRTKLESVSGSFFGLKHLRHLKFHGCITELPNDLDQLEILDELILVSTDINCLPDSICMMKNLKSLKLERCELLDELPMDLGQLVSLEKLMLSSAHIKHLPDSICNMKNLKSLKLISCVYLEELPEDLGRLECLEKLLLRECKSLKNISNSICNMKRLKVLNISCTGISYLAQSISPLVGLRVVGSEAVLKSCVFATEIQTSRDQSRKPSMASSSTLFIRKNFKYHVFLSFKGEDTRTTIVDHLYVSLMRSGIHTYRDDEVLEKEKLNDELFKAIEESKFFIIVFSPNYASSSRCLKELAKIMECQDMTERIAYPLFLNVEPTDIRKQSGPVGRAFAKHKNETDKEIIKTWKKALEDAGNLSGWEMKKIANGHEAEAIDQIVKEILFKLRSAENSLKAISNSDIQTSEDEETFCYIKAVDNTEPEIRLENEFTANNSNRWRWSVVSVVVLVVGLLVRQVIHRTTPGRASSQGSNI